VFRNIDAKHSPHVALKPLAIPIANSSKVLEVQPTKVAA
jgi:hypothetical protein